MSAKTDDGEAQSHTKSSMMTRARTMIAESFFLYSLRYNEDDDAWLADKVILAPMVMGSELAFRTTVRRHGGITRCYSPMLRADKVVQAYELWKQHGRNREAAAAAAANNNNLHEDGVLFLTDILLDTEPLVVQLCGHCPSILTQACKALLDACKVLQGIDLNLGCPQKCAAEGKFGAFLAEQDTALALDCVAAMRQAIEEHNNNRHDKRILLSCKIRLQDTTAQTIQFAKQLQAAGCQLLAVHCRRRTDKNRGPADLAAAKAIVEALCDDDMPVVVNGGLSTRESVLQTLRVTGAHAVMVATGALANPFFLVAHAKNDGDTLPQHNDDPAFMAAQYLHYTRQYPPPSPLFIRRHLRWIFRAALQPTNPNAVDYTDWRPRLWTFLVRPYLETNEQFAQVVALYARLNGSTVPQQVQHYVAKNNNNVTFASIRRANRQRPARSTAAAAATTTTTAATTPTTTTTTSSTKRQPQEQQSTLVEHNDMKSKAVKRAKRQEEESD